MRKKVVSVMLLTTMLTGNMPMAFVQASTTESQQVVVQTEEGSEESVWEKLQYESTYKSSTNESISVKPFSLNESNNFEAYADQYQIKGIEAYSNNGGQYSSSALKKAFDGDLTTHWETGKPNSTSFTNEVIVTFENIEEVNQIIYGARKDAGNKGHVTKVAIYGSTEKTGENFSLIARTEVQKTSGLTQFQFTPTQCKRIKIVFEAADQGWASAREFWFFKEDRAIDQVDQIFTDGLMNELTQEYQKEEVREELLQLFEQHPMKDRYQVVLDTMLSVANGQVTAQEDIITMPQRGHEVAERNRTQLTYAMYAHEATGVFLRPGETLQVYVDADSNGVLPEIVFGNSAFQTLTPGYNEIKLPAQSKTPAQIYLANRAYTTQQSYQPRIRIVGGTSYPTYIHGKTNPQEFHEELMAYAETVTLEGIASGEGNPNFADLFSENIHIQTSAKGAAIGLSQQLQSREYYADYTMEVYEDMYREFVEYSGFDYEVVEGREWNLRPLGKFMIVGSHAGPFGWAQHGFSGYNGGDGLRDSSFWVSLTQASIIENGGWTLFHEIAHQYDSATLGTGESTNNLYSLLMQDKYLKANRMVQENRWEKHFTNYHNTKQYPNDQLFLGVITYQLQGIYGDHIYGAAQQLARKNENSWLSGMNNKQRIAVGISMALGINVLPHYEYYGIEMNEKAHQLVADLPTIDIKSYYANDKIFEEDATAFTNPNVKPTLTASGMGQITLRMNIEEEDNALLVYELYRDGEYLGVTYSDTFVDKTAVAGKEHVYTVKAYDRKFNVSVESDPVIKNASEPKLALSGELKVAMHSEFNPLEYVRAIDINGTDITDRIEVLNCNVDTSKKGTYVVEYRVEDELGNTSQIQGTVQVVAEIVYATELTPKNSTGYYKKNTAHDGSTISLCGELGETEYRYGIGAHANTTVTYALEKDKYESFEAYIGLDDAVRNRDSASVIFEVYADGEKVYESGVIKASTQKQRVQIDLSGVQEIKLVTKDAGNGNSYDHAVWANASFLVQNAKPALTIPENEAIKVGDTLETLFGEYSATDVEDGDLTSKVVVKGSVDTEQSGTYPITYQVTDSEGNTTIATRTIAVVDMRDFTYVSEYNWKSASCGWGSIRKNLSPSGNAIRLTDTNGKEVVFEKGLGTHATSKVKYDLTEINAEYFSAYVGVDRAMQNSVASVAFEVWLDGEKVLGTTVMNGKTEMKYLEVKLTGAKELMLVATDGGNGNGSDHAVWGDAKFYYANADRIYVDKSNLETVISEVESLALNEYTIDSVTAIQKALEKAQEVATTSKDQEEIDTAVATLTKVKESAIISEQKIALRTILEEAFDKKYDQYMDSPMWEDYDSARRVYQENLESVTAYTETQLYVMVSLMGDYMELLVNSMEE